MDDIRLITPEEYAEQSGVTLRTVYNWINTGKVETLRRYKKTFIVKKV